jgi:hypothetical protein
MGFEDLHLVPRDDRASHSTNELLTFPAEHHAADDFDPTPSAAEVQI